MRHQSIRYVAPVVALLLFAGCGDGEASGAGTAPAGEGAGRSVASTTSTTVSPATTAEVTPVEPGTDAASIEADVLAAYERAQSSSGDATVDATLALLTSRCRAKSGVDDLSAADRAELAAEIEADQANNAMVVDITARFRTGTTAQVELIGVLADGTYDGALDWVDMAYDDGHWRVDDCDATARFVPVGQSIEGDPAMPEPTADDELAVATAIEAMYLGRGSAEDAWASMTARCRRVDWAESFDAFAAAFAGIAADRSSDPIDFEVLEATINVSVDLGADVDVVVQRDGLRMELARSRPYLFEDGRWRDDGCEEPTDDEDDASAEQKFEEVGERIN